MMSSIFCTLNCLNCKNVDGTGITQNNFCRKGASESDIDYRKISTRQHTDLHLKFVVQPSRVT